MKKKIILSIAALFMLALFLPLRAHAMPYGLENVEMTYEYDDKYSTVIQATLPSGDLRHNIQKDGNSITVKQPKQAEFKTIQYDSHGNKGWKYERFAGWSLKIDGREVGDDTWIYCGGKDVINIEKLSSYFSPDSHGMSEAVLTGSWSTTYEPIEYDYSLYVKFVDEDGKEIIGGEYTDGLATQNVEKFNFYDCIWTINNGYLEGSQVLNSQSPEGSALNRYPSDYKYRMMTYLLVNSVKGEGDRYECRFGKLVPSESVITFTELKRPYGYKALEGSVTASFDMEKRKIKIEDDPAGIASVKGNTLEITYSEKQDCTLSYRSSEEGLSRFLPEAQIGYEGNKARLRKPSQDSIVVGDLMYVFDGWKIGDRTIDKNNSPYITLEGESISVEILWKKEPAPQDEGGTGGTGIYTGDLSPGLISLSSIDEKIRSIENDDDVDLSTFAPLMLMSKKQTAKKIHLKWNKIERAEQYTVYGARCGGRYKKIATVSGNSLKVKKIGGKKLKKGNYYKFIVVAERKDLALLISKTIHVKTGKNIRKLKVNKKSIKMLAAQTEKIEAAPSSKHMSTRYESSDISIAKVSSKGKVSGRKVGTAKIYCYAENGVYKAVNVTVE